ncbi:MAG TPA: YfhO family protein, partial [Candidatus Eisenbacteria bacterium]|nr:YfhO family protein [Candidatus Eisenbacteria bacterium]
FKTYAHEVVGSFDPKRVGIDTDYRLLPVSPSIPEGAVMEELGLFHSATLDKYYSLTGHRMALTSQRLARYLPTSAEGLLPRTSLPVLLQSHLLRTFNMRYLLAAKNDTAMVRFLSQLDGYWRMGETKRALVFANHDALPRIYFATEIRPFSQQDLVRALIENRAPVTCALVQGLTDPSSTLGHGRVVRSSWQQDRVTADLLAPEGGFLVISMNYSPDWRATVDGRPAKLTLTNGTLIGLEVPRGAKRVALAYQPESLVRSLWLAFVGVMVMGALFFLIFRRSRNVPYADQAGVLATPR